ncbi:L-aspartate oxidase [Nocardia harenae]|uniref:L-aspartate oxidase n=1 Tax=Nocardia harenae TaxID=358707 RepID=UPI000B07FC27|nr:L-aspartate oxidase [Nocardia harenae]
MTGFVPRTVPVAVDWEAAADLVVIGGGVAGLTAARTASLRGLRVLTLSKGGPADTATQYAQGGIAVVAPEGDSVDSHVRDTVAAGAGLCDAAAVRSIVAGGQAAVAALTDLGAVFDLGRDGRVARTREGGHSTRRIIHAGGDATGAEVQRALGAAGLPVLFGAAAGEILRGPDGVRGVLVISEHGTGVVHAPAVLLATGGLGQLYALSTNPDGATADGVALALRAGAAVADLEFVQFHPTVLYTPGGVGRRPLISEAVRGEGGVLVDLAGRPVTAGVHPRGDLAPRDVVSLAIAARMRDTGADHVLLDATGIAGFAARFPTITASCLAAGVDPRTDPIPVAPAAHYQCGGVVTDTAGRTGVPGLYAAGEVARTGLHGANRLASNSLLEGLVVGERAGAAAVERRGVAGAVTEVRRVAAEVAPRAAVQRLATGHASVVRDAEGLDRALRHLAELSRPVSPDDRHAPEGRFAAPSELPGHRGSGPAPAAVAALGTMPRGAVAPQDRAAVDADAARRITAVEDAALTLTARALLAAAALRTESRGCHTRSDYPGADVAQAHSTRFVLGPDGTPVPAGTAPAVPTAS